VFLSVVCLSARIFPEPHARSLPNRWCMLLIAVARSSGVVPIRYILPVLWMTSRFFYNGPYSGITFAMSYRFRSNLLLYHKVGENSISYY